MKPFVHATHPRARPETFTFVSTENFSPSQRTNWWKNNTPREADFVFHTKYSIFWPNFLPVSYQCRFFGITAATFFSKPVISSLPMPHNFGVTRAELPFALYSAIWPTHIIKTLVNAATYSAIAIGLLVGITILSVCVCVWCHSVCGSVKKDKGQGFEIRTPVPSFFTRIFHGYICPEVAPLTTKLTGVGTW